MILKKRLIILLIGTIVILFIFVIQAFLQANRKINPVQDNKFISASSIDSSINIAHPKPKKFSKGVPVLIYHAISSNERRGNYGFISLSLFKQQLDYLKQENYSTISLDDLYNYMTSGIDIPEKSVILTFDDTNESDYTLVFRELKDRGFKGAFFTIGSKANTLKWRNRLREMHSEGMEIVSHTMNHKYSGGGPITNGIRVEVDDTKTIIYELSKSKRILEEITGSEVRYLAWPGDSYTDAMVRLAQETGYKGLFMAKTDYTTNVMQHPKSKSGFNKIGDDVLHIRRITINGANSLDDFKAILNDGIYPRP